MFRNCNQRQFFSTIWNIKIFQQNSAARHFWRNMDIIDLHPPGEVRGMTILNRDVFQKIVKIPTLKVPEENLNKILPFIKKLLLKMERLKPIKTVSNKNGRCEKEILLHPLAVKNWNCLPKELSNFNVSESNFSYENFKLNYENWRADEILKYILPSDQEALTSFSRVGHIVHINLRDHLLPYKQIIGEILKDKTVGCRSVVNKIQSIDNTYRNFQLELICGDPDYKVEVKENGVIFEFNFDKVYWNPRLSTEHEKIVKLLETSDVLYDVFAGVGPFSIPAACKKKCHVFANDLNPESFKWLNVNAKRNKCENRIKTFNKDGRDFILEDIKNDLLKQWKENDNKNRKIHITMNLPAMATEFLDAFKNLIKEDNDIKFENIIYPLIHVYCFVKGEDFEVMIRQLIEPRIGTKLADNLVGIYFVRNVAPNKDMYRASFYLTDEILFCNKKKRTISNQEINCKKICI